MSLSEFLAIPYVYTTVMFMLSIAYCRFFRPGRMGPIGCSGVDGKDGADGADGAEIAHIEAVRDKQYGLMLIFTLIRRHPSGGSITETKHVRLPLEVD